MHIEAIYPPNVFLKDETEITKHHLSEFNGSPRINVQVVKNNDGKFDIVGNNVDTDCVGGVCPIR